MRNYKPNINISIEDYWFTTVMEFVKGKPTSIDEQKSTSSKTSNQSKSS